MIVMDTSTRFWWQWQRRRSWQCGEGCHEASRFFHLLEATRIFHFLEATRRFHFLLLYFKFKTQSVSGHSGKAKKGHLCFDAIYETGERKFDQNSWFDVQVIWAALISSTITSMIYSYGQTHAIPDTGDKTSVIEYSPNSTNIMFIFFSLFCRFWFNFSVDNVHVDQRIIFNIVNLSKTRNLFTLGLTPIVRSSSRPKWWNSASNVATKQTKQPTKTTNHTLRRQRIPETNVYYYKSPEHRFEN